MADAPRHGFPRSMRLRGAGAFAALHREGLRIRRGPLLLCGRPNDAGHLRVGLGVGRRVGRAVTRNLVKRRLREALRLLPRGERPGYDVLIVVRPHAPLPLDAYRGLLAEALAALHRQWARRRAQES